MQLGPKLDILDLREHPEAPADGRCGTNAGAFQYFMCHVGRRHRARAQRKRVRRATDVHDMAPSLDRRVQVFVFT